MPHPCANRAQAQGLGAICLCRLPRRFCSPLANQDLSATRFCVLNVTTLAVLGWSMAFANGFRQMCNGAITGQGPAAREALMPLLFGESC